jgi:hypothetical protein
MKSSFASRYANAREGKFQFRLRQDTIRLSIDDWERNELEAAMLHACNAVDGTAKKCYPAISGNNTRFTQFLRANYDILGPMGAPGLDLVATRWPVRVSNPKASAGKPDIADVVYGIHRCTHGHGEEMPHGFELFPDAGGPDCLTRMQIRKGKVRVSDRVIFGLLATVVMCHVNCDQRVPDGYYLTFAGEQILINHWWGRKVEFLQLVSRHPIPCQIMEFGDWMEVVN